MKFLKAIFQKCKTTYNLIITNTLLKISMYAIIISTFITSVISVTWYFLNKALISLESQSYIVWESTAALFKEKLKIEVFLILSESIKNFIKLYYIPITTIVVVSTAILIYINLSSEEISQIIPEIPKEIKPLELNNFPKSLGNPIDFTQTCENNSLKNEKNNTGIVITLIIYIILKLLL